MQMIFLTLLGFCVLVASAQDKPEIPDDLLDTEHFRNDSALNEFTVPLISKVFQRTRESFTPFPTTLTIIKTTDEPPSTGPVSR